jgi:flagellar basal body P-ring formation protein FlgA
MQSYCDQKIQRTRQIVRLFYLILLLTGVSPPVFSAPEVLVLKHSLQPGDVLSAKDLDWETTQKVPSGAVQNPVDIIGKSAKTHLQAGLIMYPHLFELPRMVQRGQTVEVILKSGDLDIRYTGIATQDGGRGQTIMIKTPANTLIGATVIDPGQVLIP